MTLAFMGNGARKGDIQMGKEWVDKIIMEKLSEREKKVIILYKSGMTYEEIAKKLGCTQQNIGRILKCIKETNGIPTKRKRMDYQEYKTADLSILTQREKNIFIKWLDGNTYSQIAEQLNITSSSVGSLLCRVKTKLDGEETYEQKNRELVNARRRTPEHREKAKKWHKNYVNNHPEFIEQLKSYNREYYLKNRERILEKQKKNRNNT